MEFKILTFFLFVSALTYGQELDLNERMVKQAKEMSQGFIDKRFDVVSDYTYPFIVNQNGGRDSMINFLKQGMQEMKSQGIEFLDVEIGDPDKIYNAGDELHSLVSQKLTIKVNGGKLIAKSFLLAISNNSGEKWYFIDTSQLNDSNVYELFPNFNKDLIIPPKQKPIFIPD